jgi:hypothetical protein
MDVCLLMMTTTAATAAARCANRCLQYRLCQRNVTQQRSDIYHTARRRARPAAGSLHTTLSLSLSLCLRVGVCLAVIGIGIVTITCLRLLQTE